jgi:hypothetical protein
VDFLRDIAGQREQALSERRPLPTTSGAIIHFWRYENETEENLEHRQAGAPEHETDRRPEKGEDSHQGLRRWQVHEVGNQTIYVYPIFRLDETLQ